MEVFTVQAGCSGFNLSLLGHGAPESDSVVIHGRWRRSAAEGIRARPPGSCDAGEQPTCSLVYVSRVGREITRPKRYLVLSFSRGCVGPVAQSDVRRHPRLAPREPPAVAMPFSALQSAWLSPSCVVFVLSSHPSTSPYVSRLHLRDSCLQRGTYTYVLGPGIQKLPRTGLQLSG